MAREYVDPLDNPVGVRAANSVLLEVLTLLGEVADTITIVGGSAPPLLVDEPADDLYAGTLDVDISLNVELLDDADDVYKTIVEQLESRGYEQDDNAPFRWIRQVTIDEEEIEVYLDLLAPPPESLGKNRRHVRFQQDGRARRLEGGEVLTPLRVPAEISGQLPDGRQNKKSAYVAAPGAFLVLKALALDSRDKPKDAYDIDYVLVHLASDGSGPRLVAQQLQPFIDLPAVRKALGILREKFESADSYGPQSVALYRRLELGSEEADAIQARSFALVQSFLEQLEGPSTEEH